MLLFFAKHLLTSTRNVCLNIAEESILYIFSFHIHVPYKLFSIQFPSCFNIFLRYISIYDSSHNLQAHTRARTIKENNTHLKHRFNKHTSGLQKKRIFAKHKAASTHRFPHRSGSIYEYSGLTVNTFRRPFSTSPPLGSIVAIRKSAADACSSPGEATPVLVVLLMQAQTCALFAGSVWHIDRPRQGRVLSRVLW